MCNVNPPFLPYNVFSPRQPPQSSSFMGDLGQLFKAQVGEVDSLVEDLDLAFNSRSFSSEVRLNQILIQIKLFVHIIFLDFLKLG